jgi:tetratricopeptide (TPR) repeat protein
LPSELKLSGSQIESLMRSNSYDEVCRLFRDFGDGDLSWELLLRKAAAIQLAENSSGYQLDDARSALEQAAQKSSQAQAWIDLGHFYLAVDDKPAEALECFAKAQDVCSAIVADLAAGKAKALKDLGRDDEALDALKFFGEGAMSPVVERLKNELLGRDDAEPFAVH